MHAHEMEGKVTGTISLLSAKTILDCIEIRTSRIEIYRSSRSSKCPVGGAGGVAHAVGGRRSTILEPMEFFARINRNISQPSEAYPNVDIILQLHAIKVSRACAYMCVHVLEVLIPLVSINLAKFWLKIGQNLVAKFVAR